MAPQNWFFRRSPLQLAIERGTRPGGDLSAELCALKDLSIKSKADAQAICAVLERIATTEPKLGGKWALQAVIYRFQDVDGNGCPAFPIMKERGTPLLITVVDQALGNPGLRDPENVLLAVKMLALYGTPEGTDAVLRAARKPLLPDSYMWSFVLEIYAEGHTERERLLRELSDPLPSGFIAVSLLDMANSAYRAGSAEGAHPFDSPAGLRQIEKWLSDDDEEHSSYAVSAAQSLPLLSSPGRDALLALAFENVSVNVQLTAAWAAARLGRDAGVKWLARVCEDVNHSEDAKYYLNDLDRADAIPASGPDFEARAHFAQWLAHPNELGKPPDEVEVLDRRELNWPPDGERKELRLLRYRVKDMTGLKEDDIGVGLVGSITFCLFSYKLEQRSPEDCYGIHCYWEMDHQNLVAEAEVPPDSAEYDEMIRQSTFDGVGPMRIKLVAELSPGLHYPQRLVALAEAGRHGESGWVVLDGPRSRWYGASELPASEWSKTVLMLHVGRELLGFADEPDRRKFLWPPAPKRAPEQIVAAYERLLDRARTSARHAEKLLESGSVLATSMADYASALAVVRSQSIAACTCEAYESVLALAAGAESLPKWNLRDTFSPLSRSNFDAYVDGLIALGRQAEVPPLIERFRPRWDDHQGQATFGAAAFRSEHDELAETYLIRLRDSGEYWCSNDEMNLLAEIWCRKGRSEEAESLLIAAMQGLLELRRTNTNADHHLKLEQQFGNRRSAYLKLFADRGEAALKRHGIPASTLEESG